MGGHLKATFNPSVHHSTVVQRGLRRTSQRYGIEGFQGDSQLDLLYAERRQFVWTAEVCFFFSLAGLVQP